MSAIPCVHTGCRRTTRDLSGRCHDHRASTAPATAATTVPPTPVTGWVSGAGVPHPTGGYDTVKKKPGGVFYYRDREYHRLDGPARVTWGSNSRLECFYAYGEQHRDDGPAVIRYDSVDVVREEAYCRQGVRHREGGPAAVYYRSDGTVEKEIYEVDGEPHRIDGPAMITYELDGTPYIEQYYLDGEYVSDRDFARFREAIDGGAPYEWARAYLEGATA